MELIFLLILNISGNPTWLDDKKYILEIPWTLSRLIMSNFELLFKVLELMYLEKEQTSNGCKPRKYSTPIKVTI